jgi:hypothetical protein
LQKKYVLTVKEYARNGIVVTYYEDMIQARCVDYVQKEAPEGYKKPLERTAKQQKSLMGFTQIY